MTIPIGRIVKRPNVPRQQISVDMMVKGFFLTPLVVLLFVLPVWSESPTNTNNQFRVCADPNNLPYSNQKLEGFENKLAALLAKELGQEVTYTWWPQRRGFIRNTLSAGRCDVIMGIPVGVDAVLTTLPYYRSAYTFVSPKTANYNIVSFNDPRLRSLKIGVHLIGDDYANSPPAHVLSAKGIVKNVIGYSIFGNYGEDSPPGKIIRAVADGDINIAIVWGPIAGYFSRQQSVPLTVVPVPAEESSPSLPLSYSIALGVRRGDEPLREKLNDVLNRKSAEVKQILTEYGVPLIQ